MIQPEEALSIVLDSAIETEKVRKAFSGAQGFVLAADVYSDIDMPPFDKSAMDGFACRRLDLQDPLEIIENIPAGKKPEKQVGPGQCSRIMTGGMIPSGADFVIKVEETENTDPGHIRFTGLPAHHNICYRAEDLRKGQLVLPKGSLLRAPQLAVLASVGCVEPLVYRKLNFGIISTGDELVEPGIIPGQASIRNSNAWQLMAQVEAIHCTSRYYGIIRDEVDLLTAAISKALPECDILLITGGVSMGDYDHVPSVLKKIGVDILFEKIAVQPGSPTVFGRSGNKFVFGLPGNPVSSFAQFELLVKPMAYKMMGANYKPLELKMPFGVDYKRLKANRLSWIPVQIIDGLAFPVGYHGSAHIHAYAGADGMTGIAAGKTTIVKGEAVDVRLI